MSKLSIRLKELMEENAINELELAVKSGIDNSSISDFLLEKHAPSYNTFVKLLSHFNCSADYLLGLTDIHTDQVLHPVLPFQERLRAVMKEQKITHQKMIETMPVSSSVLYKWVSGKSLPNAETLIRIANFLECSVDYLIGRIR